MSEKKINISKFLFIFFILLKVNEVYAVESSTNKSLSAPKKSDEEIYEEALIEISQYLEVKKVASPTLVRSYLALARETLAVLILSSPTTNENTRQMKNAKLRTIQAFLTYNNLLKITDPKTVWDPQSLADIGLKISSLGTFVAGISVPYLWAISGTMAAYKLPFIRVPIDEKIYGNYLEGAQNEFPIEEFTDENNLSRPYLICSYYNSYEDLQKGNKAKYWDFASAENNPELAKNNQYYDSITHKEFITVPGRWIKVESGSFQQIARFATIMNPMDLQLTCTETMLKKVPSRKDESIDKKKLRVLERTVAHVGYSSYTNSFPIYYYAAMSEETADTIVEKAVLLRDKTEYDKIQMQADKKDYFDDLLTHVGITRNFYDSRNKNTAFLYELSSFYSTYVKLKQMYSSGRGLSLDELSALGISTMISIEASLEPFNIPMPNLHRFAAAYFLFKSFTETFGTSISNRVFDAMEGPLDRYPLETFKDTKKTRSPFLACKYFTNYETMKLDDPHTWNWALGEDNSYVRVRGRWMIDKNEKSYFATLEDPVKLLDICYQNGAEKFQKYTSSTFIKSTKEFSLDRIALSVGLTSATNFYPIVYYVPVKVKYKTVDNKYAKKDIAKIFIPKPIR